LNSTRSSRLVHFGAVVASLPSYQKTALFENPVLNLAWFVCGLVRGYAALLRRSGAGRAKERPWQLGCHLRLSLPSWRSCRSHSSTQKATRQHASMSRAKFGPGPAPSHNGVLQAAMSGMRQVVRGLLEGASCQTVTKIFDRCRDAVTAAGERCRAFPCDSATSCVGGRGMPRRPAAPRSLRWPASSSNRARR
jgi:hypothetical protein